MKRDRSTTALATAVIQTRTLRPMASLGEVRHPETMIAATTSIPSPSFVLSFICEALSVLDRSISRFLTSPFAFALVVSSWLASGSRGFCRPL